MYQCDARHTGKIKYNSVRRPTLARSYTFDNLTGDITVGTDGTIYVPVGWLFGSGFLYAIDSDGNFKWSYQFEGICSPGRSVPAIAWDGTVYVYTNGNYNVAGQERIYAINPNGTLKWEYLEEVAAFVTDDLSSPVVASDGAIIYSSMNTASTRISSDGTYLSDLLDNYYNSIYSSPAMVYRDTVYIREDGAIKAYRSAGGLR